MNEKKLMADKDYGVYAYKRDQGKVDQWNRAREMLDRAGIPSYEHMGESALVYRIMDYSGKINREEWSK